MNAKVRGLQRLAPGAKRGGWGKERRVSRRPASDSRINLIKEICQRILKSGDSGSTTRAVYFLQEYLEFY